MLSNLNAAWKGIIMVVVPLAFELLFVAVLAMTLNQAAQQLDVVEQLRMQTIQAERVYVESLSAFEGISDWNNPAIDRMLDKLESEIPAEAEAQGEDFPELGADTSLDVGTRVVQFRKELIDFVRKSRAKLKNTPGEIGDRISPLEFMEALRIFRTMQALDEEMIESNVKTSLQAPEIFAAALKRLTRNILIGLLISAVASVALVVAFSANMVGRLRKLSAEASTIVGGGEMAKIESGRDEIAELQHALSDASRVLAEARRRERVILSDVGDVICSVDGELAFRSAGEVTERVWGFPAQSLVGKTVSSIMDNGSAQPAVVAFRKARDTGETVKLSTVMACSDGSSKDFSWTIRWDEAENAFFCVAHDITKLRQIDKLKQDFLNMVSHDIRAPLTSVSVYLSAITEMKATSVDGRTSQAVQQAQAEMTRLLHLVESMLKLQKLEAGKLDVQNQCVSAFEVCDQAREAVAPLLLAAGVSIDAPADDGAMIGDEPLLVEATVGMLASVIKNVSKGQRITFDVRRADNFVEIGLRAPGSHAVAMSDSELSIALAKAIAETHGGHIEGQGGRLAMRIPEHVDPEDASL